jgi:hypothetical protein
MSLLRKCGFSRKPAKDYAAVDIFLPRIMSEIPGSQAWMSDRLRLKQFWNSLLIGTPPVLDEQFLMLVRMLVMNAGHSFPEHFFETNESVHLSRTRKEKRKFRKDLKRLFKLLPKNYRRAIGKKIALSDNSKEDPNEFRTRIARNDMYEFFLYKTVLELMKRPVKG